MLGEKKLMNYRHNQHQLSAAAQQKIEHNSSLCCSNEKHNDEVS